MLRQVGDRQKHRSGRSRASGVVRQRCQLLAGLHTPDEDRWFFRERVFAMSDLGYFNVKNWSVLLRSRGWIDNFNILPAWQRVHRTAFLQVAQDRFGID